VTGAAMVPILPCRSIEEQAVVAELQRAADLADPTDEEPPAGRSDTRPDHVAEETR
jgi:hypothetical protein